jgi:hypothetical protein
MAVSKTLCIHLVIIVQKIIVLFNFFVWHVEFIISVYVILQCVVVNILHFVDVGII